MKLEYTLHDLKGNEKGKLDLNPSVFGVEIKKHIVAEVVRWQLAKRRAGTQSALFRSEVRGTTKKCKPQKEQGTRHGDKRAPIFRKGGVVFAPKPRDYEHSLNKKIRALGLKIALSDRYNTQSLLIIDNLNIETHKTAHLSESLEKLGLKSALFVSENFDDNFKKAASNLIGINLLPVRGLNVHSILKHKKLVITQSALDALNVRFS